MKKIYITRRIPEIGITMLKDKGYEVDINPEDRILTKDELITALKGKEYDAVLPLLTDTIDSQVFDAVPSAKIFANYAVGFNNIDVVEANKRGITITNTPGGLTNSVAEHAVALLVALSTRLVEGDSYTRCGSYKGWDPMLLLGSDLEGKTIGILGAGRIGFRVAHILCRGFDMKVAYYDIKRNEQFEKDYGAIFCESPEELLKISDAVSIHVPLLDSTKHLLNADRLAMMKKTAFLINTSRGPVVDEKALVEALRNNIIAGAGLDVYEEEPKLTDGLCDLKNVVLTPHTASATVSAREEMSELAAQNIIDFMEGKDPINKVVSS